jgi:hypothetical protein
MEMRNMENSQLQSFLEVMPLLKDILQEDIGVVVTDATTFLAYYPGDTINLNTKVGGKLSTEEPLYKTIKDGKGYTSITPKEIYGIPFKAITCPIKDENDVVIGAIGLSKSLQKQSEVEESSETLFAALQQTNAKIEEVHVDSEKIFTQIGNMVEIVKKTEKQISESHEVLKLIQGMASQTRLLGLNASIEAARAEQYGKGFAVVAGEMKKLAQLSGDSSKEVSKTLVEMNNSIGETIKAVKQVQDVAEGQRLAIKEVSDALEEIVMSAEALHSLAKMV